MDIAMEIGCDKDVEPPQDSKTFIQSDPGMATDVQPGDSSSHDMTVLYCF